MRQGKENSVLSLSLLWGNKFMESKDNTIRNDLGRIILCVAAGVLYAVNLKTFVNSGGLLPSGFSGLTLLIQSIFKEFLHISIPYGPVYILFNIFPAIICFNRIGRKFTIFSGINILTVALLSDIIPAYNITSDELLVAVFGGIINGCCTTMCLQAGATSGGTDFISIYMSEKYGIDTWNYVLGFNVCILVCNGALFGWDKALYSMIFQFVTTQILKSFYKRYKKVTLFIVTDVPEALAMIINEMTSHGATQMDVIGTYKETKRNMLYTVIASEEVNAVVNQIKEADPKAFINAIKTDQLVGNFYLRPND